MDALPIASTVLRLAVAMTVAAQTALLLAVPIPSPVATRRLRRRPGAAPRAPGHPPDTPVAMVPALAALTGLAAVLAAVVHPAAAVCLVPAGTRLPGWLASVAWAALLSGNLMIAAAALTLRRRTGFDAAGESLTLVTDGVFRLARHPIVTGMGLLYLGFFLALPSPLVLAGLVGYGIHQQRRVAAEEALLEKRFGRRYRRYREAVGAFGPTRFWRK